MDFKNMKTRAERLGLENAYPLVNESSGLSKRELFAVMAMQGYLACPNAFEEYSINEVSQRAVIAADKLLIELCKDELT